MLPDMPVPVTALYAGLNAIIMLGLAALVVAQRYRTRIGLGDGGEGRLRQAIRAHANNAEYVPMALILIGVLELMSAPLALLHLLGAALTVGRIAHPIGLYASPDASPGRLIGTVLTWSTLAVAAIACLYYAIAA